MSLRVQGVTPAEIAATLLSPAGMAWSASDSPWIKGSDTLRLEDPPKGSVHFVEATVTGPGVAGLSFELNSGGAFDASVWIDGVRSGPTTTYSFPNAPAEVGPGQHVIRWQVQRTSQTPYPYGGYVAGFKQPTWEPFTVLALGAAAAGQGVSLSSTGPNPWKGQDRWHAGDGAAAWSGLKVIPPAAGQSSGDAPLKADFAGPGILSFSHSYRGMDAGSLSYRFDGGTKKNLNNSTAWRRVLMKVAAGPHTMEWTASLSPGLLGRSSYAVAVDQVELLPELDLRTALDTPDLTWTSSGAPFTGEQPFGVAGPGSQSNPMAVLPAGTSIKTRITGPALLTLHHSTQLSVQVNGIYTSLTAVGGRGSDSDSGGWQTSALAIGAGETEIEFASTFSETRIDSFHVTTPPESLDKALGLPEGILTTGGSAAWEVVASPVHGTHIVRARVNANQPAGWFEIAVLGPAEIHFSFPGNNSRPAELTLLVDGKTAYEETAPGYSETRMILEIPRGEHRVRCMAHVRDNLSPGQDATVELSGAPIQALYPGRLLSALSGDLPFALTTGNWQPYSFEGALTEVAVPVVSDGAINAPTLRTAVEGPGYLDFRWFLAGGPTGQVGYWQATSPGLSMLSLFSSGPPYPRWQDARYWLPPGRHFVDWTFHGNPPDGGPAALDAVHFTPSAITTLGEALDAPELVWETGAAAPWTGVLKGAPDDDAAVSPVVPQHGSSRLATTVKGPGEISFHWRNLVAPYAGNLELHVNGEVREQSYGDAPESVSVVLIDDKPATLEWILYNPSGSKDALFELDQVEWKPYGTIPLSEALDTDDKVKWTTSPTLPFSSRPDGGAQGESSAFASVRPGEETWLEATVSGPGIFDFWLREAAEIDLSNRLWDCWSLTIDGKDAPIYGTLWPAQWITGEGTHKIRLTFRFPEHLNREWIAAAVDQVSWIPLAKTTLTTASGLPKSKWRTEAGGAPKAFAGAGRDGEPAIVMTPAEGSRPQWVETTVQGPCVLAWESALAENSQNDSARTSLRINGKQSARLRPHDWQTWQLTLPAGKHVLRWMHEPWFPDEAPPAGLARDVLWKLSGMRITRGISPLAKALDAPWLLALESGAALGQPVTIAGEEAWQPSPGSVLHLFNRGGPGKLLARWGNPESMVEGWYVEGSDGESWADLWSTGPGWQQEEIRIAGNGHLVWKFSDEWESSERPLLERITIESNTPARSLAAAIESTRPVSAEGWAGIARRDAVAGKDCAWSMLGRGHESHRASATVTGPARISYWWKMSGDGSLGVSVDGAFLPVPPPGAAWTKVEFDINAGNHVVEWLHDGAATWEVRATGEAWLDRLTVAKIKGRSLAQAASRDGRMALAISDGGDTGLPWHPAAYREADGSWTEAARALSGSHVVKATVAGPALLEFRGRCFREDGTGPTGAGARDRSVVIDIGGGFPGLRILGHYLAVEVDGAARLRMNSDPGRAWQDGAVFVPAGLHEVAFRLVTEHSSWITPSYFTDAEESDLQGWVDDLRVTSVADHFAGWAASHGLQGALALRGADADGDGLSNELEYVLGSAPRDAASRPVPIKAVAGALKIPFLLPHVAGRLESSRDLKEWQPVAVELRYFRRLQSMVYPPGDYPDTAEHQVIAVPSAGAGEPVFYRVSYEELE